MSGKNQNRPSAAGGGVGWHGGVAGGCISECEVHLFGWGGGGSRYAGELEILNYRKSRRVKNFQLPGIPPPPTHPTQTDEPHIPKCRKYRCAAPPTRPCHPCLAAPHHAAPRCAAHRPFLWKNRPTKLGGTTPCHIYSTAALIVRYLPNFRTQRIGATHQLICRRPSD